MRARFGRLAFVALACCLSGCVDGATADSLGIPAAGGASGAALGGGAGVGGGSAGQSLGGGGAGGAAGLPGAGTGTGGVVECTSFADDTGWTLPVHIKNEMTQTLHVGQASMTCDLERLFQVEDGSSTVLPSLDGCHTSCQQMMESGPTTCPTVCAVPSSVTLEPGQIIELPWDGRFAVEQSLPQQCMRAGQTGPAGCVQAQRIEANAFTFIAQAGTQRECLQPGGTCTCTPNPNGGCTSAGSTIGGTIYTSEYFVKLEPGELSPSGEPQYIEIVFRDQ